MPSKAAYLVGGSVVYMVGTVVAFRFFGPEKDPRPFHEDQPNKMQRLGVMNEIATIYDSELVKNSTEWWVGITKMRQKLLVQAEGRVLEIAGGTGKNLEYYTPKCKELLVIDWSDRMVQTAVWKLRALQKEKKLQFAPHTKVHFKVMDAEALALPDDSFDTVVDTYGVCSFDDPVQAVREMGRVCKPDGKILLLEHGRSHLHGWLNHYVLDRSATDHAWKYGCTWNRDVVQIVEEAGLEVISQKRRHLGTNSIIVACPIQRKS